MKDLLDDSDIPADSLGRVFAETRHSREGFFLLDELLQGPRSANHAWARALVGSPRCGKTTFIKAYLRSCRDGEDKRKPLRYLYVEMTQDTKPTSIAYETLRWMDDPNPGLGTPAQRTTRVLKAIERRCYDVIVYDEAHYLVDSATHKVQEDGVAWFNSLLNQSRCPLILIGSDKLEPVIQRNTSLGGRTLPFPRFRPLVHTDPADLDEFMWILSNIEPQLGLPQPSNLHGKVLAPRLCIASRGRLGILEALLTHARTLARRKLHSCLTPDTLAEATDDFGRTLGRLPFNPFMVEDLEGEMAKAKLTVYDEGRS